MLRQNTADMTNSKSHAALSPKHSVMLQACRLQTSLEWLVCFSTYQRTALTAAQGVEIESEDNDDPFIIERDSGAPNEEGRLVEEATLHEIPELEEELRDALKIIKKRKPDFVGDKKKRDEIVNGVLTQVLTDKRSDYLTSIKEDRALLQKSDLANRHRMAVEVRLGEKILLEEALAMLKAHIDATSLEKTEGRPAKKVKSHA